MRVYDNNLVMGALIGRNRSFAMASLPHLETMLVEECRELVERSRIVLIARRPRGLELAHLPWRADQIVFDLIGLTPKDGVTGDVHGLYWPGRSSAATAELQPAG